MAKKNQLTTSDPLPYSEYLRLLKCLHDDQNYRWEMYACLSFSTACRVSDVLQFKWSDVLGKQVIVVTEKKTKKTRRIPINPSVQQKFNELYILLGRPDREDYVMQHNRNEEPVGVQWVNRTLKKFKKRYNLKIGNFSTHTFRKTFGRYVYDNSNHSAESLVLLNKILCHTSIQVTKAYIGITQEEIDDIFKSIHF